jgi:hypothetical protein
MYVSRISLMTSGTWRTSICNLEVESLRSLVLLRRVQLVLRSLPHRDRHMENYQDQVQLCGSQCGDDRPRQHKTGCLARRLHDSFRL